MMSFDFGLGHDVFHRFAAICARRFSRGVQKPRSALSYYWDAKRLMSLPRYKAAQVCSIRPSRIASAARNHGWQQLGVGRAHCTNCISRGPQARVHYSHHRHVVWAPVTESGCVLPPDRRSEHLDGSVLRKLRQLSSRCSTNDIRPYLPGTRDRRCRRARQSPHRGVGDYDCKVRASRSGAA